MAASSLGWHGLDADTGAPVPGDGGLQMRHGTDSFFVGVDPGKAGPGVVIDGDIDAFPVIAALLAGARIGLAPSVTGDPVIENVRDLPRLDISGIEPQPGADAREGRLATSTISSSPALSMPIRNYRSPWVSMIWQAQWMPR